jgi:hypothetical protein
MRHMLGCGTVSPVCPSSVASGWAEDAPTEIQPGDPDQTLCHH